MATTYTIHNVQTNEIKVIEMSIEEENKWLEGQAKFQLAQEIEAQKAAAKAALLARMGLTEDEARLLLG